MDALTLTAILGGLGLAMQGSQMGLGMAKGSPMQAPQTQTPSFGQTLMSQRPMMTQDQAYPKNQMQQPQQQNGSLLGNSLYSNPLMAQMLQRRIR